MKGRPMQATPSDDATIRARLLERRAALTASSTSDAGSRAPVELDQTSVGRLSRMDAMQVQAMALVMETRRADALRRIDQALARLDAGSYGTCVICGEEIAPKRLALDPAVPTCLECAAGTAR
jgi:DnaK suppressor protein